jgi:hypothetical protein
MKPIEFDHVEETARVILRTNPAMEKMYSLDSLMGHIKESVTNMVRTTKSNFYSTGGWIAVVDEWDDTIYIDLYVGSKFAHKLI